MEDNNSLEMQSKLLGAFINNPDLFASIENLVSDKLFTTSATSKSYEIIKKYHSKNIKTDIQIIYNNLIKLGIEKKECAVVASFDAYTHLTTDQVTEYVQDLFEESVRRYLTPIITSSVERFEPGKTLINMAKIKDAITAVELKLNNVSKEVSIKTQFKEAVKRIRDLKTGAIERAGFSWGIPSLDLATLGIVQGINVVAAGKGEGKSTLIINVIVENVIKRQIPMLFFSMEMTSIEVLTNVIANVRRINSKALRMGSVDDGDLFGIEEIENRLNESFVIDSTGGITHQYFKAKVRSFRKTNKIPLSETILVALDYLGLMKNSLDEAKMSKEEKIEHICIELMCICRDENIALLKLAQFSRERDRRGNDSYSNKTIEDKLRNLRPVMSDLKGSAAIESNALTILLLYRPEYHRIYESNGKNLRGICEINIAKGRYVNPEPVNVKFEGRYSLFEDLIEDENDIKSNTEESF